MSKKKDLDNLVDTLTKENNRLKKKIGKLRKQVTNSSSFEEDDEDTADVPFEKELPKKCAKCGGEIREVIILNLSFAICQKCKNRSKLQK